VFVFIDVDGTLIDQNDNPRPHVIELLQRLYAAGYQIIIWSAGGAQYAECKINMVSTHLTYALNAQVNLDQYVFGYADKSEPPVIQESPKFYIDDMEALVAHVQKSGHGAFVVPFYDATLDSHKNDNWLLRALKAVEKFHHENPH
jgi:ribonucleotide monophosphatase NagD (HAD superfamily)